MAIQGLRSKIVNLDTVRLVHVQMAEHKAWSKEFDEIHQTLHADANGRHNLTASIIELEAQPESKERDKDLKECRKRLKEYDRLEKRLQLCARKKSDLYSKYSKLTFILEHTYEEIEAHNQAIENQIQEILCRP